MRLGDNLLNLFSYVIILGAMFPDFQRSEKNIKQASGRTAHIVLFIGILGCVACLGHVISIRGSGFLTALLLFGMSTIPTDPVAGLAVVLATAITDPISVSAALMLIL